jgi:hypothetical protein
MSAFIYAIIPYKSGITVSSKEPYPCIWNPSIPELKGIASELELTDPDGLSLFSDFLMINTCQRQSAFTCNRNGYCGLRTDIYMIAKALNANEVWYVVENITDEMEDWGFSFDEWIKSLSNEKKQYVVELTVEVLKGKTMYSYYHDDFSDIILK